VTLFPSLSCVSPPIACGVLVGGDDGGGGGG
jgi:hypothetical protein